MPLHAEYKYARVRIVGMTIHRTQQAVAPRQVGHLERVFHGYCGCGRSLRAFQMPPKSPCSSVSFRKILSAKTRWIWIFFEASLYEWLAFMGDAPLRVQGRIDCVFEDAAKL